MQKTKKTIHKYLTQGKEKGEQESAENWKIVRIDWNIQMKGKVEKRKESIHNDAGY